ncbi:ENV1 protein, partial [Furnarius figulus]|nr:ENV1 protein [Furnarius figulus]
IGDRSSSLWNLIKTSYQVLNQTYPNLTQHCWLCFKVKPPYYEAIGIHGQPKPVNGSSPSQCKWENGTQGISLRQVTGNGSCVG